MVYLLEIWRVDDSPDDSRVDGHNGQNHTGKKDQCQFIHVPDPNKHHQSHEGQAACSIYPHVI